MTEIAVLGVDLGKNSCSVVGLDRAGRVVLRRREPPRVPRRLLILRGWSHDEEDLEPVLA
jgi:hypothetical protein